MKKLDMLKSSPGDFQLTYCWARAVEWQMWVAFILQPVVPILYIFMPWKTVMLLVFGCNFVWNLLFCTAAPILKVAMYGLQWTRLKWVSILACGIYFALHKQWILVSLTVCTPLVAPIIGNLIIRRPTGLIQEFFMLQLGHVSEQPRPQIIRFLERNGINVNEL